MNLLEKLLEEKIDFISPKKKNLSWNQCDKNEWAAYSQDACSFYTIIEDILQWNRKIVYRVGFPEWVDLEKSNIKELNKQRFLGYLYTLTDAKEYCQIIEDYYESLR